MATTSTSTSSLFDSPNENLHNKNVNCFMARATEVSPSVSSSPNSINDDKDDATSLKIKEEIVALDYFLSNVQGESRKHFEAILRQLAEANARLEEKGRIEREDAIEIASLNNALEEEQETRVSLEETLETIEESHNELNSKLIKERDRALAKYKKLKKEKVEFGVGHDKLNEELERLDKAHKALESKFSDLSKSHDLLQIRLTKELTRLPLLPIVELPMNLVEELAKLKEEISLYIETNGQLESLVTRYGLDYFPNNSSCEQATILEENVRLTKELAKLTSSKGKMSLDDLLSKQRPLNNKYGLGYVPYAKKKKYNGKKKVFPTQEQNLPEVAGVSGLQPRSFLHQLTMILQENIIHLMCYVGITMGMFMPNMLALLMAMLNGPFGSLRFLSLTPKDPSKNGYLNPSNNLL